MHGGENVKQADPIRKSQELNPMNTLWLQLRGAADSIDSHEMARLILQILAAAAESEEIFHPLRERIQQDEARFLVAADRFDTPLMSDIIGSHCRAMFRIRHYGWPTGECDELIAAMKRTSEDMDISAMVDAFEQLLRLCQSESRTSIREAILLSIDRAREQAAAAVGGGRWEEAGAAFADMLCSLAEARPDFEELPSLIAEAKASGAFEQCADHGVALAKGVYSILRSLVDRYASELDSRSFDGMMSALTRERTDVPPGEMLLFLSDAVGRAMAFRKGIQGLPPPERRTRFGRS
jgi:hypothetical protein